MKRNNGITLIALVITIIVLLILAGVSISLTLGNNGVLNQATNAVGANRDAKAKEEVEMAWAGATADYWSEWAEDSTTTVDADFYAEKLNTYLAETKKEDTDIEVTYDDEHETYEVFYVTKDQETEYTFTISGEGKVTLTDKAAAGTTKYLVDEVVIGDYVDIDFDEYSYEDGWRVLSKSGSGRSGTITLISAGCPLTYCHPGNTVGTTISDLGDLSNITITDSGRGFRANKITNETSGLINLLSHFEYNSYFDSAKGIHAFGCYTTYDGSTYASNTNREFETLYEYITGTNSITMANLRSNTLSNSNLENATINGKIYDSKCDGLIACGTGYWLGGAPFLEPYGAFCIYDSGFVTGLGNGNNVLVYGVRPVVSLKSGVKVANDNTGTGISSSPIKLK